MEARTRHHVLKAVDCSLIDYRPVFSLDSKFLFVVCGSTVRAYSTETGQCVHKLAVGDEVKSLFINPRNHLQLVVCTAKGEISLWDYVDCVCHKRYNIKQQPEGLLMLKTDGSGVTVLVTTQNLLVRIDNVFSQKPEEKVILRGVNQAKFISIGAAGEFVVNANANKIIVKFLSTGKRTVNFSSLKQNYTCVTAHPTDYCVATGDDLGKIFVWHNIHTDEYVRKTLHWHQLPVADLCFTDTGAHLLSVGGECVLVKWKLHSRSDENKYAPRLGMPMRWVTCSSDSRLVATCHTDNAIHLVSSQGKLLTVIQGITQCYQWQNTPVSTGLAYEPRTESLVLNGKPGHLQFYSLKEDKQLFNLDITYQNYHHREREFDVDLLDITRAAFDPSGDWLATVEVRDDSETSVDIRLKFWKYLARTQNFSLNTTVELPHSQSVNSLKFRPQAEQQLPFCVSTSDDLKFKIWALVTDADARGKERVNWICESVGYYRGRAGDAAFNQNGSILAVVFGRAVTLWDPDTNAMQTTLYDPYSHKIIKRIEFGYGQESSHLLVSVTEEKIAVWNIVSSTIESQIDFKAVSLIKDPRSQFMAAVDEQQLIVFTPDVLENAVYRQKIGAVSIVAGIFVPRPRIEKQQFDSKWEEKSQLYLMDAKMQLFAVVEESETFDVAPNLPIQRNVPETPLGTILAHKLNNERFNNIGQLVYDQKETAAVEEIFSSASNMLPSAQKQCLILHREMFLQRKIDDENFNEHEKEKGGKDATDDAINLTRKRNDSFTIVEKDSEWTAPFDWLSNLFIKL